MKLSMQISCYLLLAILGYSNAQENLLEYSIPIRKTLNNGNPLDSIIIVELQVNGSSLNVWYRYENNTMQPYPEIMSVSVYFANDQKSILKVTFAEDTMIGDFYNKPWQYAGSKSETNVANPVELSPATIPSDWLPENISRVSASIVVNLNGKENITPKSGTIMNYYGIKNFAISLEDTFVVESYMLADLSILSTGQPSQ